MTATPQIHKLASSMQNNSTVGWQVARGHYFFVAMGTADDLGDSKTLRHRHELMVLLPDVDAEISYTSAKVEDGGKVVQKRSVAIPGSNFPALTTHHHDRRRLLTCKTWHGTFTPQIRPGSAGEVTGRIPI